MAARGRTAFYKTLLPTYDVFDEERYFEAGAGAEHPENGWWLGVSICEDGWNDRDFWQRRRYWVDPIEDLTAKGAQAIINLLGANHDLIFDGRNAASTNVPVPLQQPAASRATSSWSIWTGAARGLFTDKSIGGHSAANCRVASAGSSEPRGDGAEFDGSRCPTSRR